MDANDTSNILFVASKTNGISKKFSIPLFCVDNTLLILQIGVPNDVGL
ncbi:protein of unknown function [Pseudodesulfovibrio profundus]|uniref:Uncharacterized protein n=1 Tax=Pseudodesulfovibrio profundus TaxID=57320 RepID=A0A2C8FDY6_9BACT|nr:protein of unknown function [Pseudodesulfovibrio profundus]